MPPSFRQNNPRAIDLRRSLLVLLVLVLAVGFVLAAKSRNKSSSAITTAASLPPTPLPLAPIVQRDRLQSELITIRPTGFDPAEISRVQGRFLLAVDNKSGLDTVTVRLTREDGSPVREMRLPRGQLKARERISLPPGKYLLTEANHNNWLCGITITP